MSLDAVFTNLGRCASLTPSALAADRHGQERTISPPVHQPSPFVGLLALVLGALPAAASADTFTVTTTADSGGGSLRAAVASATASDPTPDEIQFDPSLAGATITLAMPLAIGTTASGALTVNPTSSVVSGISVSGDNTSALLDITAGIVTLNRLTLLDAHRRGGGPRRPAGPSSTAAAAGARRSSTAPGRR